MLADHFAARLDGQLASLRAQIEAAPDRQLTRRTVPDKWSAADNLAHLGRYHEVFLERLRKIRTGSDPELGRYRAEEDPGFENWRQRPAGQLVGDLQEERKKLRDLLYELEASEWQLTGTHPAFGPMTITEWVDFFLLHEAHHLYVIRLRLAESN